VIYTSGYFPDQIGHGMVFEEGVNFLNKPFESARLARIVRHRLDSK
jgi:hypothetical protein